MRKRRMSRAGIVLVCALGAAPAAGCHMSGLPSASSTGTPDSASHPHLPKWTGKPVPGLLDAPVHPVHAGRSELTPSEEGPSPRVRFPRFHDTWDRPTGHQALGGRKG